MSDKPYRQPNLQHLTTPTPTSNAVRKAFYFHTQAASADYTSLENRLLGASKKSPYKEEKPTEENPQ